MKRTPKPKYIPDPNFHIEEYCDIWICLDKDVTDPSRPLVTYNPIYNTVFVGKSRNEAAIKDMQNFLAHKGIKDYLFRFTKGSEPVIEQSDKEK